MKYTVLPQKPFKKALDKLLANGLSKQAQDKLEIAIELLSNGQQLPAYYCDHALKGDKFKGARDCHIQGDLVLIYKYEHKKLHLLLLKIGSHNQVFNESFETHKELNSKLFENKKLKQDVRKALLDIVVTFVKDLEENEVPLHVVDVWLIGSNASFNYTSKSDIDLHIITNSSELSCDPALLKVVYNYAKAAFNRNHDITIKDLPVEVYIQDCESTVNSNGIYSVIDDCWVKEPKPITITYPDTKHLAQLEQLVATYKALDRNDLDAVTNLIDLAYRIRKEGQLEGEFSNGNLSFKEFRNLGYLDDLKELRLELESKELTLEKLK